MQNIYFYKYFFGLPWYIRYLLYLLFILLLKIVWIESFISNSKKDIIDRRKFLLHCIDHGDFKVAHMPSFIDDQFKGEWAIVTSSMTVSALTNIAFEFPETKDQSLIAIKKIIQLTIDEQAEFDAIRWREHPLYNLESDNGHIGYLGHLNFMLGAYRLMGGDTIFNHLHQQITSALLRKLNKAPFPYLETYPDEIYTADNMVVYASIKLFEKIYNTQHKSLFTKWMKYTKEHLLDKHTGLVVTTLDTLGNGNAISRGSWAGWNSFYLPFIDTLFARKQYENLKENFIADLPFGMKACKEYPKGLKGKGDIDSGPAIFGLSISGTGFVLAGAKQMHDSSTYHGLLRTAEAAGSSFSWGNKRQYLLSPLVGDAIILAMKIARIWDNRFLK